MKVNVLKPGPVGSGFYLKKTDETDLVISVIIIIMNPLADQIRPQTLEEFIGQNHLVGDGKP